MQVDYEETFELRELLWEKQRFFNRGNNKFYFTKWSHFYYDCYQNHTHTLFLFPQLLKLSTVFDPKLCLTHRFVFNLHFSSECQFFSQVDRYSASKWFSLHLSLGEWFQFRSLSNYKTWKPPICDVLHLTLVSSGWIYLKALIHVGDTIFWRYLSLPVSSLLCTTWRNLLFRISSVTLIYLTKLYVFVWHKREARNLCVPLQSQFILLFVSNTKQRIAYENMSAAKSLSELRKGRAMILR